MNILRRVKISKNDRKHHHLVVSEQVHDAVRHVADTRRLTMTEAGEYLIRLGFVELFKAGAKNDNK
jgi:hypothetical protein